MQDDAATPMDVGSNAELGLLREKREVLFANSNVAIWGCIISSNIWSASGGGPMKFLMGALWLVFAALILWIERDADGLEAAKDLLGHRSIKMTETYVDGKAPRKARPAR